MKKKIGRPVKWTEKEALKLGLELITWLEDPDHIWFENFLYLEKGLYPQLTSELCDKYTSFSELIKKAKKMQECKIVDKALNNETNTIFSIFLLKNAHAYADKLEQKIDNQTTFKLNFGGNFIPGAISDIDGE